MSTHRPSPNTTTTPTAKYLQSRISHLSLQLLKRYNALLSAAASSSSSANQSSPTSSPQNDATSTSQRQQQFPPPSAIETVSAQIDIEVETQAIIKAAEEIMVLTRGLKELWLFGGLDTVDTEARRHKKESEQREVGEEVRSVREGLDSWLEGWAERRRMEMEGMEGVVVNGVEVGG